MKLAARTTFYDATVGLVASTWHFVTSRPRLAAVLLGLSVSANLVRLLWG